MRGYEGERIPGNQLSIITAYGVRISFHPATLLVVTKVDGNNDVIEICQQRHEVNPSPDWMIKMEHIPEDVEPIKPRDETTHIEYKG